MPTGKDKKIFVLDTSVILYSHDAILNFEEHDVGIPITVLEELDHFKKGNDTKNFEAREFIRMIDQLSSDHMLDHWIPLNGKSKGKFKVLMTSDSKVDAEDVFDQANADHKILNAALKLQQETKGRKVILVTKDINLRLKAKALNLNAEDYETGKIKNVNSLYTGKTTLDKINVELINELYEEGLFSSDKIKEDIELSANKYYILKSPKNSVLAYYNPINRSIEKVEKKNAYGIKPRNAEQTFALHAILNPEVRLVTIRGVAGTGKTLLALAGALEQRRSFKQIYLARPIVPLSNTLTWSLCGITSSSFKTNLVKTTRKPPGLPKWSIMKSWLLRRWPTSEDVACHIYALSEMRPRT